MIDIHVYGFIKKKFDANARLSEQTIIPVECVPEEIFSDLLIRLDVVEDELGDCFINGLIAEDQTPVPDGARVAIFGAGMRLLCGGAHLKGHGYVNKTPPSKVNYY